MSSGSATSAPAAFPPPVSAGEFIATPEAGEDDRIEVGVLIVGGGPAGMATAIRVAQAVAENPELAEKLGEVPIAVVDKAKTFGAHQLSGAVVNPKSLQELLPGVSLEAMSSFGAVSKESVYLMTPKRSMKLFPTPPNFHNKGNWIFSLAKLTRFLADQAEELGVMLLPETSAEKLLVRDGVVAGIVSGDRGRSKTGGELGNFEPGAEIHAQVTILCEGTQGHLTGAAFERFELAGENPQVWALGVKEVWEVEKPLDQIIHTMGWPLRTAAKYREFGGSFIYPMDGNKICIGMVMGLDYRDETLSVHDVLQKLKTHPRIKKILAGGKRVSWGAKTIPEGGYWALPKQFHVPGMMIAGDAAGTVNVPTLKGVQYAVRSGMLAGDTIVEVLKAGGDLQGEASLAAYDAKILDSEIHKDLYRSRNMKQVFHKGFFMGGFLASLMEISGGRFPGGIWKSNRDADEAMFDGKSSYPAPDGSLTFDKLSSVFVSGNKTRDDQPNHIRVATQVSPEVARTWVNMCPAAVYELEEGSEPAADGTVTVQVNPSNCVHCGAITAKGGRLTPSEGGSGPEYTEM